MDVGVLFAAISDFFDQQFFNLFLGTLLLFAIMFITWWVYRKLSTRNIFLLSKQSTNEELKFHHYARYVAKYFFLFPLLTFLGFVIFSLSLFILVRPSTAIMQENILLISIILVSTIRVSAYVHELMAEDLAKLVPLALLGIVITQPSAFAQGLDVSGLLRLAGHTPSVIKYFIFIIVLEALLRGGTWLFYALRKDALQE